MSQTRTGNTRTFVAGGSINAYKSVRRSTTEANTVHHCTANTTVPVGVSLFSASDGDSVTVQMDGTVKVVAARAITAGQRVTSEAAGKCGHTTTANDAVLGIALETTTNTAGTQLVEIDLTPKGSNY